MAWPGQLASDTVAAVDLNCRDTHATAVKSLACDAAAGARPRTEGYIVKVDSTLRGPIRSMIEGVLEGSGRDMALLAPAFPEQGRLLVGGRLRYSGIREGPNEGAIALADVPVVAERSLDETYRSLIDLLQGGVERIVVVDSKTGHGLEAAAQAWKHHKDRIVLAGSSGVVRLTSEGSGEIALRTFLLGDMAVVSGSPSVESQAQIRDLRDRWPQVWVAASPPVEATETRDNGEIVRALATSLAARAAEDPIGLLVVSGGATVRAIAEVCDVRAISIEGELEPGVSFGSLIGGVLAGVTLVTKAGGFGDAHTLTRVLHRLVDPAAAS